MHFQTFWCVCVGKSQKFSGEKERITSEVVGYAAGAVLVVVLVVVGGLACWAHLFSRP